MDNFIHIETIHFDHSNLNGTLADRDGGSSDIFFQRIETFFNKLYFQQIIYKILYCLRTKKNASK